jgi:hypothetical protein
LLQEAQSESYVTRFGRVSRPPVCLIETAYEVIRPVEAMKALREEVIKAIKINIWHLVHVKDLTKEQQKLIIPQMIYYLEKYKPDATFDKIKVRALARGDKQVYTGESEGPVARTES